MEKKVFRDARGLEIGVGDLIGCAFRTSCHAQLGLGRVLAVEEDRVQWQRDGCERPSWVHYPDRIVRVEGPAPAVDPIVA